MTTIFLFIIGLALGSFLNVAILRFDPNRGSFFSGRRLGGRSACPQCGQVLSWRELIPLLSFFWQRGRCRHCSQSISWQYPTVELVTGFIFALTPLWAAGFYGWSGITSLFLPLILAGLWVLIFVVMLVIVVVDLRHYLIPDELTIFLGGATVLMTGFVYAFRDYFFNFYDSFISHYSLIFRLTDFFWVNHIFGALAGGLFFYLIHLLSRGQGMGFGDVKLMAVLGFLLGWPDVVLLAMLAFIIGGLWGGGLVLLKMKQFSDRVPFAPFIILGAILTIGGGAVLVNFYFQTFNL